MMVPRVLNVDGYMYVPHSSMCRSFSMAHTLQQILLGGVRLLMYTVDKYIREHRWAVSTGLSVEAMASAQVFFLYRPRSYNNIFQDLEKILQTCARP